MAYNEYSGTYDPTKQVRLSDGSIRDAGSLSGRTWATLRDADGQVLNPMFGADQGSLLTDYMNTLGGGASSGALKRYGDAALANGVTVDQLNKIITDPTFLDGKQWAGDQNILSSLHSALGGANNAGLDTAYQSIFNPATLATQDKALADNQALQKTGGSDFADIVKGMLFAGGGALMSGLGIGGNALAGGGGADLAAAFGDGGLGYGAGSASMGGAAGSAAGALTDAAWGVNPQGGNVDWLDEILNSTNNFDTGGLTGADQGAIDFANQINDVSGLPSGPSGLDVPGGVDAVNAGGATGGVASGITMADLQKIPASVLKALGADSPQGMARLLGTLGTGALSAMSANKYADNMKELADRSWNAGTDYRNRLSETYTNPSAYLNSPEVKAITDRATNSLARSLSARDGNPIGSGRALTEIQDYGTQTMLGQLGNYRQQLANFGGQSALTGNYGQLGSQSAEAGSNIYNSLANTVSRATTPATDWASIMRQFGGNNSYLP